MSGLLILAEQQHNQLSHRFHLPFEILPNDQLQAARATIGSSRTTAPPCLPSAAPPRSPTSSPTSKPSSTFSSTSLPRRGTGILPCVAQSIARTPTASCNLRAMRGHLPLRNTLSTKHLHMHSLHAGNKTEMPSRQIGHPRAPVPDCWHRRAFRSAAGRARFDQRGRERSSGERSRRRSPRTKTDSS